MSAQRPQCDRHPTRKLSKLAKPPRTATRERLPESGKLVSSFFQYWRCPACKVNYCTAKVIS